MPIVICEFNGMYYKYAYFIFIITVFIFCFLIARDKYLLFYKRAILSFRYHKVIFLSVVFSQNQARHLTA